MAVEIKYVVVREGQEKMAFASKKDADAYDKMLDLAEVLGGWLQQSPLALEEAQNEQLAMWLAENKDLLAGILRNGKLPEAVAECSGEQRLIAPETGTVANASEHPEHRRGKAA